MTLNLKGSITGFSGFFSLWVLEEEEERDGFWRLGIMKSKAIINFFLLLLLFENLYENFNEKFLSNKKNLNFFIFVMFVFL